ncbi:MAG: two-component regulator propeller domain-containing protein [Saprospiraceae bacterium]|nr:two-component regulator propeller domain-containing protein [Saprospiraceae bacterium]
MLVWPALTNSQATFINIGEEKGFSSLQITDFYQDNYGFVWVGTQNGLNRFDGYEAVQYLNYPSDTTSLSSNHISPQGFVEDAEGNLWVATFRGGLNHLNLKNERFIRYRAKLGHPNSISMDNLLAIEADGKGGLWIATSGRGINHFNPATRQFRVWEANNFLMGSTMTAYLKLDRSGQLWIGTNKGVCCYSPNTDSFVCFPFVAGLDRSLSDWYVTDIEEDSRGNIWLGTANGLNRWDATKGVFVKHFFSPDLKVKAPGYDYILKILEDDHGRLWLGTVGGLLRFDPETETIEPFIHIPDDPFSIGKGPINAILKDRNGNIWFGTNNGISILNKAGNRLNHERFLPVQATFKKITQTEGVNAVLELNGVFWLATQSGVYRFTSAIQKVAHGNFSALFWDKQTKEVYGGTVGDGFYVFDAESSFQTRHIPKSQIGEEDNPFTMKGHRTNSFAKDCQGHLWIAANGCLNRFDPASGRFRRFHNHDKNLPNQSGNLNMQLLTDWRGNLWIASMGGLSRVSRAELSKPFDTKNLRFEHYLHQPGNLTAISSDVVLSLLESADGHLWIGTDAGLNQFEPQTGAWKWFSKTDGLPGNEIVSLVEDRQGNIWVGDAHDGLAKFDKASGRFFKFSKKDGLNTEQFRPNAGILTAEGFVVMGGRTGLVAFHPDSLSKLASIPSLLYFTDFKIFNQSVPLGSGAHALAAPIYQTKQIKLDYDQNVVSFQFASLRFYSPEMQVYRFQLFPFQREWQYIGGKREVTFTNLDPGNYELRVEASENGHDWSGRSLAIQVLPPWYRTWGAYLCFFLSFGGILFSIRRYELKRQMAKAEARRLQELDAVKSRLYTNITHEFRTPLTVILGEASQLEAQAGIKQKKGISAIRRQGMYLLKLVNQMLDLSKVEAGSMQANMVQGNVLLFLKYLLESFQSLAASKQIELRFETDTAAFQMDYDPDKWQKIISNLLANALKFTPSGGKVALFVDIIHAPNHQIRLQISDTGRGIPKENIPHIFERFYQNDDSLNQQMEGTGIGLAHSKELILLLGGQIQAQSPAVGRNEGSTFTVTFPVSRKAPLQEFQMGDLGFASQEIEEAPFASALPPQLEAAHVSAEKPRLLLIEDNTDVMQYLASLLTASYQVFKAQNGKKGLEMAFNLVPDIVISDVMMPQMDGFEVCQNLKTDERTSHIPVILLTAKADQTSKIEGLKFGADAYLAKPFHQEELVVRLEKLVELRRRLQARFQQPGSIGQTLGEKAKNPEDLFLQKVRRILESHLDDEDFGMLQLCTALNMSRSNLFRKIKALTGLSATIFILNLRLEKARSLLETTDLNVSEVSYATGFGSPNYFSRAFHEAYGVPPGEMRKRRT